MKLRGFSILAVLCTAMMVTLPARLAQGQTQTPGQISQFDPSLNVVDSVITQDPSGKIGIGTTTPASALDVATGDLNVAGNVLKDGILFIHTFGPFNTFIGKGAGNLALTGSQNTASGFNALTSNTDGSLNTSSGWDSLQSNTSGNYNTATGAVALNYNATGNANTATGAAALQNNTMGGGNTASGYAALLSNTIGIYNTAYGVRALQTNVTGCCNTAIGHMADVATSDLTNATAIGFDTRVNASNKIRLGNADVTVIEGQVPYTFTSDRNQKEGFRPVDGEQVLSKIGTLSLTSWNYIGHNPKQFRHYGPVAQEFFAAFGHDSIGTIGTPTTINSGDMEGILMIAVQALSKRSEEQKQELEILRAENAALRTQLLRRLTAVEKSNLRIRHLVTK